MSMDKWEEAAGTAALNIGATRCSTETLPTEVVKIRDDIVTAHADLRRTFGKLVELVKRQKKYIAVLNRCDHVRSADENVNSYFLSKLLADPDIQAAMKGEEG